MRVIAFEHLLPDKSKVIYMMHDACMLVSCRRPERALLADWGSLIVKKQREGPRHDGVTYLSPPPMTKKPTFIQ